MMRTILAAIAGGAALFLWSFLSWVVLPIHSRTISQIPQEEAVIWTMHSNITAPGVYFFPGLDAAGQKDPAAMAAWTEKYERGPIGFIVYSPAGNTPFNPGALAFSFLIGIFSAGIGIWLFHRSTAIESGYFAGVSFFGMIGILICLAVYLQEWIHMKYPLAYSLAFCTDAVVGWFLMGAAVVPILNRGRKK